MMSSLFSRSGSTAQARSEYSTAPTPSDRASNSDVSSIDDDSCAQAIDQGRAAVLAGEFNRARDCFDSAMHADDKRSAAHAAQAWLQFAVGGAGHLQRAQEHLQRAEALVQGDEPSMLRLARLQYAAASGDGEQIALGLHQLQPWAEHGSEAVLLGAQLLVLQQRNQEAGAALQTGLKAFAGSPSLLALQFALRDSVPKGEQASLQEDIRQLRRHVPVPVGILACDLHAADSATLQRALFKQIRQRTGDGFDTLALGLSKRLLPDDMLDALLQERPNDVRLLQIEVNRRFEQQQWPEAFAACCKLQAALPCADTAAACASLASRAQLPWPQAEPFVQQALHEAPTHTVARSVRAKYAIKQQRGMFAVRELEAMLGLRAPSRLHEAQANSGAYPTSGLMAAADYARGRSLRSSIPLPQIDSFVEQTLTYAPGMIGHGAGGETEMMASPGLFAAHEMAALLDAHAPDAEHFALLGDAYRSLGQMAAADDAWERSLRGNALPADMVGQVLLSRARIKIGQEKYDAALGFLRAISPDDAVWPQAITAGVDIAHSWHQLQRGVHRELSMAQATLTADAQAAAATANNLMFHSAGNLDSPLYWRLRGEAFANAGTAWDNEAADCAQKANRLYLYEGVVDMPTQQLLRRVREREPSYIKSLFTGITKVVSLFTGPGAAR